MHFKLGFDFFPLLEKCGFQLSFMDWSRGPPEGVEEFLKFCLHSDVGLSRALSSVLILIGASCPWLGLCSHSNRGFLGR